VAIKLALMISLKYEQFRFNICDASKRTRRDFSVTARAPAAQQPKPKQRD